MKKSQRCEADISMKEKGLRSKKIVVTKTFSSLEDFCSILFSLLSDLTTIRTNEGSNLHSGGMAVLALDTIIRDFSTRVFQAILPIHWNAKQQECSHSSLKAGHGLGIYSPRPKVGWKITTLIL